MVGIAGIHAFPYATVYDVSQSSKDSSFANRERCSLGGAVHRRARPGHRQDHLPERPGQTQAEVREKLKAAIGEAQGLDAAKTGKYTVGQWMDVWYENYAKIKVRPSSHQTYRGYIENHIKPNIGSMPLNQVVLSGVTEVLQKAAE